MIWTSYFVKIAMQSSSHSCPKEIRVPAGRESRTKVCFACSLRLLCRGKVVVYLGVVVSPVATLTVGPLLMCCLVWTVVLVIGVKWCVAAESTMLILLAYTASVGANWFILLFPAVAPLSQGYVLHSSSLWVLNLKALWPFLWHLLQYLKGLDGFLALGFPCWSGLFCAGSWLPNFF